jgi:lipid-A-disaccharide synthase
MWLDNTERRTALEQEFARIHLELRRDASARAAQAILNLITQRKAASSA